MRLTTRTGVAHEGGFPALRTSAPPIIVGAPRRLAALFALALATIALANPLFGLPGRRDSGAAGLPAVDAPALAVSDPAEERARDAYERLPLAFAPNRGQSDERVRYLARGQGFGFFFAEDRARLSFITEREQRAFGPLTAPHLGSAGADVPGSDRGMALDMRFLGASDDARLTAGNRTPGTVNELGGSSDRAALPTYGHLRYHRLWPGIDMRFRGTGGKLKYEFLLRPGADPSRIGLAYAGAQGLSLSPAGSLLIETPLGTLRDSAPRSYQPIGGRKVPVDSRYALARGGRSYGFELGAYDPRRPLVIDPGIVYSTFLGGTGGEGGAGIAIDTAGSAYVAGGTTSTDDFPTTPGAFEESHCPCTVSNHGFVTKFDPTGSTVSYSTYLGGSEDDAVRGIAVDSTGSAYVTGYAGAGFPTTDGAFDEEHNGAYDAFLTKLNATGSDLTYSTYLGGSSSDFAEGIAVDGTGNAYVTGLTGSTGFPTTDGAFDEEHNGGNDAFVTKLNAAGSAPTYSTFLGGDESDGGEDIALDSTGNAYVAGSGGTGFPTTSGAFDPTYNGDPAVVTSDAVVAKLNTTGTELDYSTFLGGTSTDTAFGIAVDGVGAAYATGITASDEFPTTPGAFDTTLADVDAFVTKLNSTGSDQSYSTFLGGSGNDQGRGIEVDGAGVAYVTGLTEADEFPTTPRAFDTSHNGGFDAFLAKLNATGSAPVYSTYLGGTDADGGHGIAIDGAGVAYVTGGTESTDFPTSAGAFDTSHNSGVDAFVTKIDPVAPPPPPDDGSGGEPAGGGVTLAPGACANERRGTEGPDTLSGTTAGDRLLGLGGADVIDGLQDDDCLLGGRGNDGLSGDDGADSLLGGRGRDRLTGGSARDFFSAGRGNDRVNAADGLREIVSCGPGRDTVRADRKDRLRRCERRRPPR